MGEKDYEKKINCCNENTLDLLMNDSIFVL